MSKIIYVCLRKQQDTGLIKKKLDHIARKITPDNIAPRPTHLTEWNGILFAITNPHPSIQIKGASVCLGSNFGTENWDKPGEYYPDGTYALFRGDQNFVQILTDAIASRTVWYFMDDEKFVASTSQRALINMLNGFEFNPNVIPWMLSTGSIGPEQGWDSRIKRLGGDSVITLDRVSWSMTVRTPEIKFEPIQASDAKHETSIREVIDETFQHIRLDYSQWVLLLSGGFDSRSILCFLKDRAGLKTVTWGLKAALNDKYSDAAIAKRVAQYFNLENTYFETDIPELPIETIFHRYLVCGDGEVDHVSGYMDGFHIWQTLCDMGMDGIIRGDEGFGWVPVTSPLDVRLGLGIPLWNDFANLKPLETLGLPPQEMPEHLAQHPGETLESWRDRLYHQFRIPVVLGGLSDLKLPYVEIINPLLSRRIIHVVRKLPDHLRTGKILYKAIVLSVSPKIDFARQRSLADKEDVFRAKRVVDFLRKELSSDAAQKVLPRVFLEDVLKKITSDEGSPEMNDGPDLIGWLKGLAKAILPKSARAKLKGSLARPKMDYNALAFRAFLICGMHRMLSEDQAN